MYFFKYPRAYTSGVRRCAGALFFARFPPTAPCPRVNVRPAPPPFFFCFLYHLFSPQVKQIAKMSIDPKFVELTAEVLNFFKIKLCGPPFAVGERNGGRFRRRRTVFPGHFAVGDFFWGSGSPHSNCFLGPCRHRLNLNLSPRLISDAGDIYARHSTRRLKA